MTSVNRLLQCVMQNILELMRLVIKLPFAGVKGDTDSRPVQVQVPCMEMRVCVWLKLETFVSYLLPGNAVL